MISALELLFLTTSMVSILTGVGIFLLNPYRAVNLTFVLTSATIALWFFSVFMVIREARFYTPVDHGNHIFWLRFGMATAGTLSWSTKLMIDTLAGPGLSFAEVVRRSWPWMLVPAALVVLTFSEAFIPSDTRPFAPKVGIGYPIYFGVMALHAAALIICGSRHLRQFVGVRRIEMQIFVLNTLLAGALVILLVYAGRTFHIPTLSRSGPFVFIFSYGVTVWTICSHRIFDAQQVIASVAFRLTQFVVLGAAAIILTAALYQSVEWPYDILLAAIATGLLALLCEKPMRRWFGLDHDFRLIEPRREVVSLARQRSELPDLTSSFESYLKDWCQTDGVALLPLQNDSFGSGGILIANNWPGLVQLCKEGWITPELLQRRKPEPGTKECSDFLSQHRLGALLAVPPGSESPTLVVALGVKRSLRPYTYPDIRLLLNLAELMDNILTHANLTAHAAKIAQMEAAAMMSRSLAHDLNNLTMPVATYLLHTHGRAAPGTPEGDVYDAALHSVKIMHDYIRESLFFSRRLTPAFSEVSPAGCLTSVIRLSHERATRKGVTLQSRCETTARFIVDRALFQRLVMNLVNNAIDASDANTQVTITLTAMANGQISLKVSDQGSGIKPENLKRIFDPYFTTKDTGDSVRGLGLGLAICRKITDLHGGTIEASSDPGRGATFTVLFPAVPTGAPYPEKTSHPKRLMDLSYPRVLPQLA